MVLKKKRTLKGENDFALSCPNEELCVGICCALKFLVFFQTLWAIGSTGILDQQGVVQIEKLISF